MISDAHRGIKAAVAKAFHATRRRCRVHFMRNALAHAAKGQRQMVAAMIRTAFTQPDAEAARAQWRQVSDNLKPRCPRLAAQMDEAESDVLSYMAFPADHRDKLRSTSPLERLNGDVKRRTDVIGIFPNEAAIIRLVGAIRIEQNDEWASQGRYMPLESFAGIADNQLVKPPAVAA